VKVTQKWATRLAIGRSVERTIQRLCMQGVRRAPVRRNREREARVLRASISFTGLSTESGWAAPGFAASSPSIIEAGARILQTWARCAAAQKELGLEPTTAEFAR